MSNMFFQELFIPENTFYDRVADFVAGFNAVASNGSLSNTEKVIGLTGILNSIVTLAVNEGKLAFNEELFDDCVLRIEYLGDIIGDSGYSLSPAMIADGTLLRQEGLSSIWEPLIAVREDSAKRISLLHEGLLKAEAKRQANPLLQTSGGLQFRLPPAGEGSILGDNTADRVGRELEPENLKTSDRGGQVLDFAAMRRRRSQRGHTL